MKKIYLLLSFSIFGMNNAQSKFGVNAGALLMKSRVEVHNQVSKDNGNMFYGGVFGEFPIDDKVFKLVASANYANDKGDTYLYTPIYFKASLFSGFNLQAGTSLLTYLNKKPDAIQRLNFALTGGVGYEFEKFTLDARYNYQTNDYLKDSSDANSLKINYFNIGLGYKF